MRSSSNKNYPFQRLEHGGIYLLFIHNIFPHCQSPPRPIETNHFNDPRVGDFSLLFIQQIIPHCRCPPRPIKTTQINDSTMGEFSFLCIQQIIPHCQSPPRPIKTQSFQRSESGGFLFPLHSSFGFAHIIILGDSEKVPTS